MSWFISILLTISGFALHAQTQETTSNKDPLEGSWVGVLTHPGGYKSEYVFHLEIQKTGEQEYKCWSLVKVDNIYGEMGMTGTSFGDELLILEDKEILTHDVIQGMEWCWHKPFYLPRLWINLPSFNTV